MKKDPNVYFLEILILTSNIRKFVGKKKRKDLIKNHQASAAVLLELTIIGETVKKIDPEIKNKIDLPWKEIAGFRDIAVHDYSRVDNEIVAGIVFDRLDEFENKIKKHLKVNN